MGVSQLHKIKSSTRSNGLLSTRESAQHAFAKQKTAAARNIGQSTKRYTRSYHIALLDAELGEADLCSRNQRHRHRTLSKTGTDVPVSRSPFCFIRSSWSLRPHSACVSKFVDKSNQRCRRCCLAFPGRQHHEQYCTWSSWSCDLAAAIDRDDESMDRQATAHSAVYSHCIKIKAINKAIWWWEIRNQLNNSE